MGMYFKAPKEVTDACANGAHLCPRCLGGKAYKAYMPSDFLGDKSGYMTLICEVCDGTGLEKEKPNK
jgi:uncharacterized protein (DUF983 family)